MALRTVLFSTLVLKMVLALNWGFVKMVKTHTGNDSNSPISNFKNIFVRLLSLANVLVAAKTSLNSSV